jgi:Protein of unknown function (DUF3224)
MHRVLAVSTAALAVLFVLPLVALASSPIHATASGTLLSHTQTPIRSADGNLTFSAVDIVVFSGDIAGTATDTYTFTVHPDGSITGHGTETCAACTIGGRTGGYTEAFNFTATANFASFAGRFAVLSGTGGLAGLRGEGTFQGAGFSETINLNYHFAPGP